jgi:hypothetical protein
MAFWDIFKPAAASAASTILGSVTSLIDEVVTNKEERETLKLAAQKQVQDYTVKMEELAQASDKMYLEDTANARDMQKTALNQNDLFSKRFVYYLAIFWSVAGSAYIFAAPFLMKNEGGKEIVTTTLGFLLGTIVSTVINFYFGSSKGSSDKQDLLNAMTNKK